MEKSLGVRESERELPRGKARTKGEKFLVALALGWVVCCNGGEGCLFIGDGDGGRERGWSLGGGVGSSPSRPWV